jgi:hypothetical protein
MVFLVIVAVAIAAGLGVGSLLRGKGVVPPVASGTPMPPTPPTASTVERTLTVPEIVMSAPAASAPKP